jgi:hypothetical protein
VGHSANWQVFDWVGGGGALLNAKHSQSGLSPGNVTIGIEGNGTLAILVDGDQIDCERTEKQPALSCAPLLAHRLLFGPLPPSQLLSRPTRAQALSSWCPLPLYWASQDTV